MKLLAIACPKQNPMSNCIKPMSSLTTTVTLAGSNDYNLNLLLANYRQIYAFDIQRASLYSQELYDKKKKNTSSFQRLEIGENLVIITYYIEWCLWIKLMQWKIKKKYEWFFSKTINCITKDLIKRHLRIL